MRIAHLSLDDSRQVGAALGWLELGNPLEAKAELTQLSGRCRNHPEVLRAQYLVCEATHDWDGAVEVGQVICRVFPKSAYGWNQLAYALHQLRRTEEAYQLLLPVFPDFPSEAAIPYNLACYACQLGRHDEAWEWLKKSIDLAGPGEIRTQALADADLEPLRFKIAHL